MANTWFQFKQFTLHQERTAMKVGTDGVLLGAWVQTTGIARALDVGTGTGLIALMLAQRSTAQIDAIDVEPQAAQQARENVAASPWHGRVRVWHKRIQDMEAPAGERYDLLVSNPPFFSRSLKSANWQKAAARHDVQMQVSDLIAAANRLLNPGGSMALILPYQDAGAFRTRAMLAGWYPVREMTLYPREGKAPHRMLLHMQQKKMPVEHRHLAIRNGSGAYTAAYKAITQDFYLHF